MNQTAIGERIAAPRMYFQESPAAKIIAKNIAQKTIAVPSSP